MRKRLKVNTLRDFFSAKEKRPDGAVFFERICEYNSEIRVFLREYYAAAMAGGIVIEKGLKNPVNSQLSYYTEVLGTDFRLDKAFIYRQVNRWLPRIDDRQCDNLSSAITEALSDLKNTGKNDYALKNAYIKIMCWLYYRAEPLFSYMGGVDTPKILYDGMLSQHGLMLLSILSACGCDIVLLELQGDADYLKLDPESRASHLFRCEDMKEFPADYGIETIRKDLQEAQEQERLLGPAPQYGPVTNIWLTGDIFQDIQKDPQFRGDDPKRFYNAFCRVRGVEDKADYESKLYKFQLELKKRGRKILILNDAIPIPSVEEIAKIHRENYRSAAEIAAGLAVNIQVNGKPELEHVIRRAFIEIIMEKGSGENPKLGRLSTSAVYLLCWLERYRSVLLTGWQMPDVSCFIYLGGCRDENEALFCRFLAKLPVDVLILNPDLNRTCCLSDALLFEKSEPKSLRLTKYPEDEAGLHLGTTAFHAEQDLDSMMYGDTGIYRSRQFSKASVVTLRTMYEEIQILWNEELKFRPNFGTQDEQVIIPVICAKVSGVKERNIPAYWSSIKTLMTQDTLVFSYPRSQTQEDNPFVSTAGLFIRNGVLRKNELKTHNVYPYGLLKESVQDYILEKIQILLSQNLIKDDNSGDLQNRILAALLNLDKEIVRLIQNFDFTKKNPKLIGIVTGETVLTKEDAIVLAFLNLIGFDIALFVPTGYQCFEQHYTRPLFDDHQIGDYVYDLSVPDLSRVSATPRKSFKDFFFRRNK